MRPIRRLSTKFALLFAALLSLVMLSLLSLAGYFVFESTDALRMELRSSFSSVQSENDMRTLLASGEYLSNRLFNPLYKLDISGLNEEIDQIRSWLEPESILILDASGKVVTDGTPENTPYGVEIALPAALAPSRPVIEQTADGQLLFFAIGYADEIPGYARIALSDARGKALIDTLNEKVLTAWQRFEQGFVTIALISIGVITFVSMIIGIRLTKSLSRPLREMTRAAELYASGNLTHKLPERSEDEIGRLARALNTMASDLEKADLLLTRAQEMAALGSWEWRRGEDELRLSHGVYQLFGVSTGEFSHSVRNVLQYVAAEDQERLFAILQGRFEEPVTAEFGIVRGDGALRRLYLKGEPEIDAEGRIFGFIGTLQDVTEQRRSQEQLLHLANYDDLTRLPNRNLFYDRLRHATLKDGRQHRETALLFLDLDRFKAINDALGHDVGDELLRHVAKRLQKIVRKSDTLARMGGDEFTLILEGINDELMPHRMAQKIIDVLTPAFIIAGKELHISASIGIALFPKDARDADTLIKNADTAMYVAKEHGRSTFRFFTPELDRLAHERLALEHELRRAIKEEAFELHFQPQVHSKSGKLFAMEALLRWRHNGVLRYPGAFMPVLEDTGLITRITGWVLFEACSALERLRQCGMFNVRVAVNLSARQFQQTNLLSQIDKVLAEHSIKPGQLELEITEDILLDLETCQYNASQLAERGVRLAIDDFGTGYSSLTYLKRLHVDTLKIDRSFVQNILEDSGDAQITRTVVALAQGLGLECVAEGVEEVRQLECLRDYECDLIQGYLVCRPVDIEQLIAWTKSQGMFDTGCYWKAGL